MVGPDKPVICTYVHAYTVHKNNGKSILSYNSASNAGTATCTSSDVAGNKHVYMYM